MPDARIDDVDADAARATARADDDSAAPRVAQRIGNEIAQDPLEQPGVGDDGGRGLRRREGRGRARRLRREVGDSDATSGGSRRRRPSCGCSAPASSRDRSSSCANSSSSASIDEWMLATAGPLRVPRLGRERGDEQSDRMQRLAQVMARRGKELALGAVGGLRRQRARDSATRGLHFQLVDEVDVLVAHGERVREHVVELAAERGARSPARREARAR